MCDECDDTRSLDFSNDCYFERPGINGNFYPPHYMAAWKPPSTYFPPRGEAPPPYEEAIATTSNCLIQAPMPSYITMCSTNGVGTVSSTTIILTNENINHPDQVQNNSQRQGISHQSESGSTEAGGTITGETLGEAAVNKSESKKLSSGSAGTATAHSEPGPSAGHSVTPSSAMKSEACSGSQSERHHNHHHHHRGNASGRRSRRQSALPHQNHDLPPYSASNFRDCFRHSLTLPRQRDDVLDFDLDTEYGRRHQQRYSLQFNVADWSSSSSTLSLSTPNTPIGRPESSLSSSTSTTSNNT